MRYFVTGSNRDTGARMTLEFDAESKAAAERKAALAGMSVHRVEDVTDGHPPHASDPRAGSVRRRRRRRGGTGLVAKMLIGAAIALVAYYVLWPLVRPMLRSVLGR